MGLFDDVKKGLKKARDKTVKGLRTMHLDSIAEQANIKKLVSNPGGYFKSVAEGYKKDIGFGGTVWKAYSGGDWDYLFTQGAADTQKAFLGKEDKRLTREAGTIGKAYEAYDKGDYSGVAKAAKGSEIGFVSDTAAAAEPYAGYVEKGAKLVKEADRLNAAYEEGGERALLKAGKESDVKLVSDIAGWAEKGKKAYKDGKAAYDKGKKAYDQGQKLYADYESGDLDMAAVDKALAQSKASTTDKKKNHPTQASADRAVGKGLAIGASPGFSAKAPVSAAGQGGFVEALLRLFGLGASA